MNSTTFRSFLDCRDYPPIILKPTYTSELANICSLFSPRKATGYDNISMRVIKHSFDLISAPLADIINLSLWIFPDKLKIGKVIPIYKTEDPSLFENYRPISLLPNFSKFFEKVMYNRLVEFAETNEIFYLRQFGFRKNHSTSHALIHLLNKISSAIDQHESTVVSFWIFPRLSILLIMEFYSTTWNTVRWPRRVTVQLFFFFLHSPQFFFYTVPSFFCCLGTRSLPSSTKTVGISILRHL